LKKQHIILFFASSYQIGLTCLLTEHLCALCKIRHISLHAVFGEGEQLPGLKKRLENEKIHYTVISGLDEHRRFYRLRKELYKIIEDIDPDYIMVQTNWQLALVFFTKKIREKCPRIIYWVHGYRHNHLVKAFIARIIIGCALRIMADHVIVSASPVAKCFRPFLRKGSLHQYFLGVDQLFFDYTETNETRYSSKTIIFPAQFREGKNQEWLIRAVAFYIQKTNDHNIKLILPGDGIRKENCRQLAKDLKIYTNIIFPGQIRREELVKLYSDSAIAVIPSNNETFGSCIAEPFILGNVVVSRPVGCAIDLIHHKINGFLFKNESELKELLLILLKDSKILAIIADKNKNDRYKFSWNKICASYVNDIMI
jgi:glycosyltransferase involved in cell wall biosynthesis